MYMTPDELRSAIHQSTIEGSQPIDRTPYTQEEFPVDPRIENETSTKDQAEFAKQNPQTLYSWTAPLRAYKKKPAGVFKFYFAVAALLTIILFFLREYILAIPIWATMFLIYALTITPPHDVLNTITKFGIHTGSNAYQWVNLSHFYFIKKFDYHILVVFTKLSFGHPIYLVIPNDTIKQEVLHLLAEHLIYQEAPVKTFADTVAEVLTSLMPEEEPQTLPSKHVEEPLEHHKHEPTEGHLHQQIQQHHQAPSQV